MTSTALPALPLPSLRTSAARRAICLALLALLGWVLAGTSAAVVPGPSQPAPPLHTPSSQDTLAGLRNHPLR